MAAMVPELATNAKFYKMGVVGERTAESSFQDILACHKHANDTVGISTLDTILFLLSDQILSN